MVTYNQLVLTVSPVFIAMHCNIKFRYIADTHDKVFYIKWGSFYYEFHNSSVLVASYYSFFMIRRFLFAICQVFLNDLLIIQVSLNATIAFLMLFYTALAKPFKLERYQRLNTFTEIGICSTFLLVTMFIFDLSDGFREVLSYTIITVILLTIVVNILVILYLFIRAAVSLVVSRPPEAGSKIELNNVTTAGIFNKDIVT